MPQGALVRKRVQRRSQRPPAARRHAPLRLGHALPGRDTVSREARFSPAATCAARSRRRATYQVRLKAGGQTLTQPLRIVADPKSAGEERPICRSSSIC